MKKNKPLATLGILISLFVLIIFVESIVFRNQLKALITTEVEGYGYFFIMILSALLEFLPQFVAPTVLMLNSAVLDIPLAPTTLFVITGSTIGAIAAFAIGKAYGKKFVESAFGEEKIKTTERFLNSYGRWFVAVASLTPLPYVPLIFGSLGMKTKNMIVFGFFPRAVSYIFLYIFIRFGLYTLQ